MAKTYKPKSGKYAGKRFKSYTTYRNRLAKDKGYKSYADERNKKAQAKGYKNYWEERKIHGSEEFKYRRSIFAQFAGKDRAKKEADTFDRLYARVLADREDMSPDGPLADFLDYIGVRPKRIYRDIRVGDTDQYAAVGGYDVGDIVA